MGMSRFPSELVGYFSHGALVIVLQKLLRSRQKRYQSAQQAIRLELGWSLPLSLEFLLTADIVGTAVSPS
jgi:uncharacterized membrane protein